MNKSTKSISNLAYSSKHYMHESGGEPHIDHDKRQKCLSGMHVTHNVPKNHTCMPDSNAHHMYIEQEREGGSAATKKQDQGA